VEEDRGRVELAITQQQPGYTLEAPKPYFGNSCEWFQAPMTGSYWSARPADVLSNLVTRRGYSSQCQLLLHVLSGYKGKPK